MFSEWGQKLSRIKRVVADSEPQAVQLLFKTLEANTECPLFTVADWKR